MTEPSTEPSNKPSAAEPPALRGRDFPMACLTIVYASCYAVARGRAIKIIAAIGLPLALVTWTYTHGLQGLLAVVIGSVVGIAVVMIMLALIAAGLLLWNLLLPNHHVWALPSGRAVLTARRTRNGWRADNASALPVGRGIAAPLLDAAVDHITQRGGFDQVTTSSHRVATYYATRYGAAVRSGRIPGRALLVENEPPDRSVWR